MANTRALRFMTFGDDCIAVVSHRLNQDGYFRKRWVELGEDVFEMFHRTIWRYHHGPIPEGYEVDHICKFRACCNVDHLRLLSRSEHTIHTNKTRTLFKNRERLLAH